MNLISRLRERLKQEGIFRTCRYTGHAAYDTMRCLARDAAIDWRYSGKLLDNRKTLYSHLGSNDVYHSDYDALDLIFQYCCPVYDNDVLVDVGCGKGRVINYWLNRGYKNRIVGLELDPLIADETSKHFSRLSNIKIIAGDAIQNLPEEGTLFYFYNPFSEPKVRDFEQRINDLALHRPVTVVYYNPKSLYAFHEDHWNIEHVNFERDLGIKRWGRINKFHDLAIITSTDNPRIL